jgi:hypothetical protein
MLQTQYSNITDPLLLTNRVGAAEAVILAADTLPYICITGLGALPASGGYVIGVNALERSLGEVTTVTTEGIEIVRVATGAVIDVDTPLACTVLGTVRPATGSEFVVGYSRDTSTGSTALVPHYIRVAIE